MLVTLDDVILWFSEVGPMSPTSDVYLINQIMDQGWSHLCQSQETDQTYWGTSEKKENDAGGDLGLIVLKGGYCLFHT